MKPLRMNSTTWGETEHSEFEPGLIGLDVLGRAEKRLEGLQCCQRATSREEGITCRKHMNEGKNV